MVISMSDFSKLSQKEQHSTLDELKQTIGVAGIMDAWGISRSKVYSMMLEFNIPSASKRTPKNESRKTTNSRKESKNGTESVDQDQKTMASNKANSSTNKRNTRKTRRPRSTNSVMHAGREEDSKFTLQMDTQGSAAVISEALQHLLESSQFSHTNLHINLMLEQI
ncbi:MAG TPA: hypothetical protein VN426_13340 [Syntrophomonadaceae bacterium]|nr:hypothetical protein [Syntrophomonadaceae bacterium]